jgi:hypothetical protein
MKIRHRQIIRIWISRTNDYINYRYRILIRLTEELVVSGHFSLTLVNLDLNLGLTVSGCAEHLSKMITEELGMQRISCRPDNPAFFYSQYPT